jgi:hypothetical protein
MSAIYLWGDKQGKKSKDKYWNTMLSNNLLSRLFPPKLEHGISSFGVEFKFICNKGFCIIF